MPRAAARALPGMPHAAARALPSMPRAAAHALPGMPRATARALPGMPRASPPPPAASHSLEVLAICPLQTIRRPQLLRQRTRGRSLAVGLRGMLPSEKTGAVAAPVASNLGPRAFEYDTFVLSQPASVKPRGGDRGFCQRMRSGKDGEAGADADLQALEREVPHVHLKDVPCYSRLKQETVQKVPLESQL
jgi:hypothetical protein